MRTVFEIFLNIYIYGFLKTGLAKISTHSIQVLSNLKQ